MTKPEDYQLVRRLFEELADLPAEEQRRVLAERDLPDSVREQLTSLLAHETVLFADGRAEAVVQELVGDSAAARTSPGEERLPERIAGFRVEGLLGRGGMGVVYRAVQEHPRREVAVKVLHSLGASPDRLRRFEYEAEILARLDHPYVAKVFQAGVDPELGDLPYLAMELVEGRDLVSHCDALELSLEKRLELFRCVCEGVEHAHQNGIVHRDLKPANILVSKDGRPRILDFGIARPAERPEDTPGRTETGHVLGSLSWMSPEQARGALAEIDTRTDVYSLGVLLYRLLSGEMPYDVTLVPAWEAARVICEEDPPRLGKHARELAGDLEAICAMALEKESARRYPSAGAFGRDVGRYLEHEPIDARAWSATYHLKKLARRHRGLVAAAATVLVVAIGGLGATAWVQARANVDLAQSNEDLRLAKERADEAASVAEEVNRFLNEDLLAAVRPSVEEGRGVDVTLRQALDAAAARIEAASEQGGRFADQPLVEAQLRKTICGSYYGLGQAGAALPHAERALELHTHEQGEEHPDTLGALQDLVVVLRALRRDEEALEKARVCWSARRRVLGEEHPDTLTSLIDLALSHFDAGLYDQAEGELLRALELRRRILGETHPHSIAVVGHLVSLHVAQGRRDDAEARAREVLELRRATFGDFHPDTPESMDELARLYLMRGEFDEAEALLQDALRITSEIHGESHRETLTVVNSLAAAYKGQGRYEDAERTYLRALEGDRQNLGEEHPGTLSVMSNLAALYETVARYEEAEALHLKVVEVARRRLGDRHLDTLTWASNLAAHYAARDMDDRAESLQREYLELMREALGPEHPMTLVNQTNLAYLLLRTGRFEEGGALARESYELRVEVLGATHLDTLTSLLAWAHSADRTNEDELALELLETCLDGSLEEVGRAHPWTLRVMQITAEQFAKMGRFEEAESLYRERVEGLSALLGSGHADTREASLALCEFQRERGDLDASAAGYEQCVEVGREELGLEDPWTLRVLTSLVRLRVEQRRYEDALELGEELLWATAGNDPQRAAREALVDAAVAGASEK